VFYTSKSSTHGPDQTTHSHKSTMDLPNRISKYDCTMDGWWSWQSQHAIYLR